MLPLLFLTADAEGPPSVRSHRDMQRVLMHAAFQDMDKEIIQQVSTGMALGDLCRWPMHREPPELFTVHCRSNFLTALQLVGFARIGRVHYEYLPPSIELLIVSSCKQKYKLETRLLPRRLREINMSFNKLYGSIDMQHLPPNLEKINLLWNKIVGPISLQRLPPKLISAELHHNAIRQHTVPCGRLPARLERVDLRANSVHKVVIFESAADGCRDDVEIKAIFPEMKVTRELI